MTAATRKRTYLRLKPNGRRNNLWHILLEKGGGRTVAQGSIRSLCGLHWPQSELQETTEDGTEAWRSICYPCSLRWRSAP